MRPCHTRRLTIRNFMADDWRALQSLVIAHNATPVAQYDHAWPTDDEQVRGACAWFASGDHFLALCLAETGALIGYLALSCAEQAGEIVCDLGYLLHPDFRGQGYGSEACRAALERAFGELGAARVVSNTAAANEASCRLLRRLGFVEVGREAASLREDAQGQPITFEGVRFEQRRSGA